MRYFAVVTIKCRVRKIRQCFCGNMFILQTKTINKDRIFWALPPNSTTIYKAQ